MSLKARIITRIAQDGPLSVADYMAECLLHPELGYYTTRDPLGAGGDFTTAPEISQMYGELIGLALAQAWMDQGTPEHIVLAELGPGRGTLMADALRATRGVPGFHDAAQVALVEVSPTLRAAQAERLEGHAPQWFDTVDDLPDGPLFLIANEFFDALPIRQFVRSGDGWAERCIGAQADALAWGLLPPAPQSALAHRLDDTHEGDLVEHCPALPAIAGVIAQRIATHGGAALIADYGDWRSLGDTFQALEHHEKVNPLDHPGRADLTAHVDFEAIAVAAQAQGARYSRLTPQGVFLERLGITQRAQALAARLGGAELDNLVAAHRRLTHPEEMGNLFKVIGIYSATASPPPGLDA